MRALPSLKQLQYLIALGEQLNFTRAAESCFVTQSTLSAGLKELEDVLGAQLVERDRQTVLMTPLGIEIARRARDILSATRDLSELASNSAEPMSGPLRLGVIPTIAPFLLPQIMAMLRERYPALQLALREDLTTRLLTRLDEGQLDFALIALPYPTDKHLVETLFDDPLWVVGRKGDPALQSRTVAQTDELTERLLLLEEGHCLRDHTLQACGYPNRRPAANIEATSLLTLMQMVESGLGLALVPGIAVKNGLTASPGLVARPLRKPGPSRTITLVARPSTARQHEMQILGAIMREAEKHTDGDDENAAGRSA